MAQEMVFCTGCGRQRGWGEAFCGACGRPFVGGAESNREAPRPMRAGRGDSSRRHRDDEEAAAGARRATRWYHQEWAIITALVLFPPLGVWLMWEHASWSRRTQKLIGGLLVWPLGAWWIGRETDWPFWLKGSVWFAAVIWVSIAIGLIVPAALFAALLAAVVFLISALVPLLRDEGVVEPDRSQAATASGSAHAEPAGRLGEVLRAYARAGQIDRVRDCLGRSLPDWPARVLLMEASVELFELDSRIASVPAELVPRTMTSGLAEDARGAAEVLWRSADRIAAAAALSRGLPTPPEGLQRETEQLERLLTAIRDARRELAELPLSAGSSEEVDAVARSFRGLATAARGVRDEMDELAT